ncbi:MAG TPA: GNAT family N-acetyltransferase [Steroidobacteraceae bacterium]|nr:GNAT family N-acetyltransferase [Steroidobacteraceae bacterium]
MVSRRNWRARSDIDTNFTIAPANWLHDPEALQHIRRAVFIVEQQVPESEEWDEADLTCVHALVLKGKRDAVGTGRLEPTGKIGRLAVLNEYRGLGLGGEILEWLVGQARRQGLESVYLHAQVHALPFYLHHSFVAQGPVFDEAGIAHQRMSRKLTTQG